MKIVLSMPLDVSQWYIDNKGEKSLAGFIVQTLREHSRNTIAHTEEPTNDNETIPETR